MATKKKKPTVVAIDLGFGYSSAARRKGDKVQFVRMPSVVSRDKARYNTGLGSVRTTLQVDGQEIHVGESALLRASFSQPLLGRMRTQDDSYGSLYLAVIGELFRDVYNAGPLRIITGLPIAHYADAHQVKMQMKGDAVFVYDRMGKTFMFSAESVICAVQHFGSIYYHAFTADGKEFAKARLGHKRVAAIDIGTYTTGLVLSEKLVYIEDASQSEDFGMVRVHNALSSQIYDKWGLDYSMHRTDAALRSGYIQHYKKQRPILPLAKPYMESLVDDIYKAAINLWGSSADLDALYIVGGGAYLLGSMIAKRYFPMATIPDKPERTNVLGLLRLGLYLNAQRK